jgi:hypothetical protein
MAASSQSTMVSQDCSPARFKRARKPASRNRWCSELMPGSYSIRILYHSREFVLPFSVPVDALPTLVRPLSVTGIPALLIASRGPTIRVHSNQPSISVKLDKGQSRAVPTSGLTFDNQTIGAHQLSVNYTHRVRSITFHTADAPSLKYLPGIGF